MLHPGIDLHKRTVVVSTVTPDGQPVRDATLPTARDAVRGYFAALPGPHRAVVASTATWYSLRDLLVSAGVDLRLGHSKYIKAISYAKVKTDAVDAATLARLRRSALIPEAHMVGPGWREARDLLRARLRLVGQQVRCKSTLDGLLAQYNVTTPTASPPLSHAAVRAIQYVPEIRAFYRATSRRKPPAVARALVAKELARIVDFMLVKQEPFNGTFKGKPLSLTKQPKWPRLANPPV